MRRSSERILTAGSLARPAELREMLAARDERRPYDAAAFAASVRSAVAEVVRQQTAVGLDVVNDGEQSKRNFTSYARERLGGVEERPLKPGEHPLAMIYGRDAAEFPEYFAGRGNLAGREAVCVEPLTYIGHEAVRADVANFKAALAGVDVTEAFLPAVAPGTIEHWLRNEHYASDEAYLAAIADAMKVEYDAIVDAGFLLQIDDPDLADAWQIHPRMSVADYRQFAALRIEALNHALHDPEGKILIPGVVGHASDFVEHPELVAERLIKYAGVVGRDNVIAGTDCGLGPRVGHPKIAWAKFEAPA